jgi:hypothetical protein
MNRDDSLAFACGSMCLEISSIASATLQCPSIVYDTIHASDDLVTWLVEGGRFLILVQTAQGTRVYDPQDDFLYYAVPHTQLGAACPVGHAFLCQPVLDARGGGGVPVPRLLVTDLVSPPILCPKLRGETLRSLGGCLASACHLQWSGNRAALERFVGGGGVPHRVGPLVALRAPLVLAREPVTAIGALNALSRDCLVK